MNRRLATDEAGASPELQEKPPHMRYVAKLFPGSSHVWALECAAKWELSGRILDVGVGSGVLGCELFRLGFKQITGIEIDPLARSKAQVLGCYEAVLSSPTDDACQLEGFSHALVLDVLEHVAEPHLLLAQIRARLKPGGTVLISVPNITHWTLRLMLLAGFFRYAERGPLDKTHLRFFSISVLKDLIASDKQLQMGVITSSIVPLELMLPEILVKNPLFELLRQMRISLARRLPSLFGYQLLVEVKKITA